ncbi:MAG: PAAR domain-containing protein, partial [Leadbetterella sp.]
NVFIGGMPAAVEGGACICAGSPAPDSIKKGSSTVSINGKGAARQFDTTIHNGSITTGLLTVQIGG